MLVEDGISIFRQPKTAKGRRIVALPPSAALVLGEHRRKRELDRARVDSTISDDDLIFC